MFSLWWKHNRLQCCHLQADGASLRQWGGWNKDCQNTTELHFFQRTTSCSWPRSRITSRCCGWRTPLPRRRRRRLAPTTSRSTGCRLASAVTGCRRRAHRSTTPPPSRRSATFLKRRCRQRRTIRRHRIRFESSHCKNRCMNGLMLLKHYITQLLKDHSWWYASVST